MSLQNEFRLAKQYAQLIAPDIDKPTTLTAALTLLAQHNAWRRGVSDDLRPTDARELGAAIDLVCGVVPLFQCVASSVLTALSYPRGSEAQVRCLEEVGQDAEFAIKKAGGAA